MKRIDLHTHTSHSFDGDVDPAEVVRRAHEQSLDHIAITDHNLTTGIAEAVELGKALGVDVIPGIEIDCTYRDVDIHLLGYFIDYADPRYETLRHAQHRRLVGVNRKRVERIRELGLRVNGACFADVIETGILPGTVIIRAAMEDPRNADSEILRPYRPGGPKAANAWLTFWWDWCAQGKPASVEVEWPTLREALDLIMDTGGVPIIAHPGNQLQAHTHYVPEMMREGVAGLEVYCSYHNQDAAAFWREIADRHGMLGTCGSDFHGTMKPDIELGRHGGENGAEVIWEELLATHSR